MKVRVCGADGPVAQAARAELQRRGHTVADDGRDCAVFFPGTPSDASHAALRMLAAGEVSRLVVRSSAYAYGSNPKNPGMMTEDRVSLLPAGAPEQRWLQAEEIACTHPNAAAVRLSNVCHVAEGDLIVRQLSAGMGMSLSGHDPNLQFISVVDAARALASAAESNATGIFNASGGGAVPLRKAFKASRAVRIPVLKPLAKMFSGGAGVDQLQYNWTVSCERAARELGFTPEQTSVQALAKIIAHPERLEKSYDDWGLDLGHIGAWGFWFAFLRNVYWRIQHEGMENIPAAGPGLFVSNHRGFMPLDAVMHLSMVLTHRNRVIRFLIIPSLLRTPFMCNFLTKLGGVVASQENATRLFEGGNLVGIFPEGIRGTFTPYKRTHQLRDFSKSEFARIAIQNQTPVIPVAVVGHADIFPIIGRIDSEYIRKEVGWPYLPIAPLFPLAPVPLPSKWHMRVLPPIPTTGLKAADADNARLVKEFSRHVQRIMQQNIDDMAKRRKHIYFGKVLDGTAPPAPAFSPKHG
jgi:1-acyl-sn-glycerol-3-phosphate acyltransferase